MRVGYRMSSVAAPTACRQVARRPTERFMDLVAEALDALPEWVHRPLDNVEVLVDDHPPDDVDPTARPVPGHPADRAGQRLLGRAARPHHAVRDADRRGGRARRCRAQRVIGETVVHEIAHHFGIDDERLHEIDRY